MFMYFVESANKLVAKDKLHSLISCAIDSVEH